MALLGRNLIVKTDGNPLNTYVFYDDIQLDYVQKIEFDNKVIEVNGKPVEIRALFNTPLVIEVLVPLSDKHILMDYHEKPITKKLYGYGDVIKIAANSIPSSGNAGLPF